MNTLLTIAIPTYNRLDMLKICLNEVLYQAHEKSVEIIVSDNHSNDGTEQYMLRITQEHPNVSYFRNNENIGPDRNFLNCYSKAKSEYVLLIGDDDLLLPGAIESILFELVNKPIIVHLNTCSIISRSPLIYTDPRFIEGDTRKYTDINDAIRDIGIFITFVSSIILRTDLVKYIQDKDKYIGTYFLQSHIALRTMANAGSYFIITKNCIAATGNTKIGYDLYYVWGEQYNKLLFETAAVCGVSNIVLDDIYYSDLKGIIFNFILDFRQSCPNERAWKKACIIRCVRRYPKLMPRFQLAVYTPRLFILLIMQLYKYIRKFRR